MFETPESARLSFSRANAGDFFYGEHLWSYVRINASRTWFHVTFKITAEDDREISETLLLSSINELLKLKQIDQIKIEFVNLVSPGWRYKSASLSKRRGRS